MKTVGVIGLGDMGFAMAKNLIAAGFATCGFDPRAERRALLDGSGGTGLESARAVGERSEAVFVMVLNGDQAKAAILDPDGVAAGMARGGTVIVTATIMPAEVREIATALAARGLSAIDTPVSGGRAGAEAGTLTLMAAASSAVLEAQRDVLRAVAENIHHVGEEIGMGQTVKGALQAVMGATMASLYEAMVLGRKAGIPAETLVRVFTTSSAGSKLMRGNMEAVAARRFTDTGSGIWTMYKDLGITLALAREHGVPMFTAAAALELFQAGIASFPDEDNQAVAKVIERAAGLPDGS